MQNGELVLQKIERMLLDEELILQGVEFMLLNGELS